MYTMNERNQLFLKRLAASDPVLLNGRWSLGADHMLRFHLNGSEELIIFKTSFVSAEANKLVFSVTVRDPEGSQSTRLFQFEGTWQTDEKNRLVFVLSYSDSSRDRFIFEGRWKVGAQNEIVYRYTSVDFKNGRRINQKIILRGSWKLAESGYLTYSVEGSSDSTFRFRAEFMNHRTLRGNRAELSFRVAIQIQGSTRKVFETIKISGRWIVRGPLELGFEITYEDGRVEEIKFLASYEFVGKNMIDLEFFNSEKEGLGIQMTLLTKFFGDRADLFLKARAAEKEKAIEGGVKIKW